MLHYSMLHIALEVKTWVYYTVITRKKVHFSFTVEIPSCRLIFCILKTTSRLGGSSGSHNCGRAYHVLVQKEYRKYFFRSWNEESSLCTPSEATRHPQDTLHEHKSFNSEDQKLLIYQLDVYWNGPGRVLATQSSWTVSVCFLQRVHRCLHFCNLWFWDNQ